MGKGDYNVIIMHYLLLYCLVAVFGIDQGSALSSFEHSDTATQHRHNAAKVGARWRNLDEQMKGSHFILSQVPTALTSSHCGNKSGLQGACLGLVGIYSHPAHLERRVLHRSTWLRFKPPGIDFVFILGQPDSEIENKTGYPYYENLVRWEQSLYGDLLILNTHEVDTHLSGTKSFAFFSWAALHAGKWPESNYLFIAKCDDDAIVNPLQLRLLLMQLALRGGDTTNTNRHGTENQAETAVLSMPPPPTFWGLTSSKFDKKQGVKTEWMWGAFYLVSADVAMEATLSEDQLKAAALLPEDVAMAKAFTTIIPSEKWTQALPCEIYNHEHAFDGVDPQSLLWGRYNQRRTYSKETIAAHELKRHHVFMEAFSELLPFMEAMHRDCWEWFEQEKDHSYLTRPAEQCRRWHSSSLKCSSS
ncbi:hypothetical protein CEUSTIGMA_g12360.t1 [Chlamydomonas eustigma]|uniref:Hexosyltransferase n=1 Tax=Chlamydomonas eustigma TaxID=1157962 RepID=A0A250XPR3_9CHLO|nr:hypothetical protein CEUSTIGMA_g12360.t1 [Chlamydomonas eustigma]|eukprot:GAX84939.1 hypothetical protein CEUSTIGMA_g12360.t1 [Chlamydomonas eustigma]